MIRIIRHIKFLLHHSPEQRINILWEKECIQECNIKILTLEI
nr:MAG TPA: hypothetical protein [Caudoviricetes sp.]